MAEKPVEQVLENYGKAISWAESIVPNIPSSCRIYRYLELLRLTVQENLQGISTSKPTLLILDAHQQSNLLIEIHRKFGNRTDKAFVQKLRESLLGPVYTHDEEHGEGPSKSTFARDIESELLIATRMKNPNIVSFEGNDVVYDLGEYKFGVEVKRIHSMANIQAQFTKGCQQIEGNPLVSYGMVAFRFDKHFLILNVRQELELIERGEKRLSFTDAKACGNAANFQTNRFLEKWGPDFLEWARKYPKVKGACIFCYLPGMLDNSSIPFIAGHVSYGFFIDDQANENNARAIFERMKKEFESPS